MNKLFFNSLVTSCVALLACASPAAWAHAQQDRIAEVTVLRNQTLVKFKGIALHGCSSSPYFILSEGDTVSEPRRQMLAIALAAIASGKTVYILTGKAGEGDVPCSANGYEWIHQLSIIA